MYSYSPRTIHLLVEGISNNDYKFNIKLICSSLCQFHKKKLISGIIYTNLELTAQLVGNHSLMDIKIPGNVKVSNDITVCM